LINFYLSHLQIAPSFALLLDVDLISKWEKTPFVKTLLICTTHILKTTRECLKNNTDIKNFDSS